MVRGLGCGQYVLSCRELCSSRSRRPGEKKRQRLVPVIQLLDREPWSLWASHEVVELELSG